jgi:hypothetical protein
MGAVREWFDVVGGVRSGLKDEPPWWAPAAIAVFGALVVGVVAVGLVFGVDGGGSPESARLRAASAAAPGPAAVAAPAGEATGPGGTELAGDDDDDAVGGETLALADRTGTFQQVPRAAVAAARAAGADRLGLPVDGVRHQLISTTAAGVELTVASLDGRQVVTVTAVPGPGGTWQVP